MEIIRGFDKLGGQPEIIRGLQGITGEDGVRRYQCSGKASSFWIASRNVSTPVAKCRKVKKSGENTPLIPNRS